MDIWIYVRIYNIIFSILTLFMKITLAAPLVCPELYSYMHFLDLSLYITTFIELHTVCLFPTSTIPVCNK